MRQTCLGLSVCSGACTCAVIGLQPSTPTPFTHLQLLLLFECAVTVDCTVPSTAHEVTLGNSTILCHAYSVSSAGHPLD
eukprot:4096463-Pleurochrysis_carterae.AAC.2